MRSEKLHELKENAIGTRLCADQDLIDTRLAGYGYPQYIFLLHQNDVEACSSNRIKHVTFSTNESNFSKERKMRSAKSYCLLMLL